MAYVFSFLRMHVWTILYEYVWILLKFVDWFNHHFGFLVEFLSILWCIFSRVFPSHLSTITGFQGVHSSQPTCVRTSHAPSFTHCNYHTLATNRVILLACVRNRGQGITIRPTAGSPTPNGLRSNWDFLSRRSPWHVGGSSTWTFLALEGGPDDKLCPLIRFWTFAYLSWILALFSLCDVFRIIKMSPSQGIFFDLFSTHMYDGEGKVDWPKYLLDFLFMLHEEDGYSDEHASLFLAHTLCESPRWWMLSIPANRVHSLENFYDLIEDTFCHFDPDYLDRKLL